MDDIKEMEKADALLLPGVGAFEDAARKLKESGLGEVVAEEARNGKPTMGICMGHLLMARAMGGNTVRMSYGHHGGNQPVKDLARGTCVVTSQSHLHLVDKDNLPANAEVSHINWNDKTVEGLRYADKKAFSVAFVPGGLGGPFDTTYLFDEFLATVREGK